jgi:integrative and conjugative element protein (TIGR02256 family)
MGTVQFGETSTVRKPLKRCWLSLSLFAEMCREASLANPRETGGVLLGYWSGTQAVICSLVSAGPKSQKRNDNFVPDHDFQERQIATLYKASGRLHTYLGDWHSHPDGLPLPSGLDRRTLKKIARYGPARAPMPLMLIVAGRPGDWQVAAWIYRKTWPTGRIEEVEAKLF